MIGSKWYSSFLLCQQYAPKLNSRKSYCYIICGVFNFGNIYNFNGGLKLKPLDGEGSNLFLEQGFSQLIDTPTRYSNLSTSLIDLIFMNKTENVILQAVLPTIADHLGTMLALNCMTFQPKEKKHLRNTSMKTLTELS